MTAYAVAVDALSDEVVRSLSSDSGNYFTFPLSDSATRALSVPIDNPASSPRGTIQSQPIGAGLRG